MNKLDFTLKRPRGHIYLSISPAEPEFHIIRFGLDVSPPLWLWRHNGHRTLITHSVSSVSHTVPYRDES